MANVNARDAVANFTPLHWAAGNETLRPQLVKLLLGSGADPNAAGGEPVGALGLVPQTPRLIAEKRGRTAIVDALAAAGARDQPPPEKIATPKRTLPVDLDHSTIVASAEKALAALQSTAAKSREAFLRHVSKQDCVSCHQTVLADGRRGPRPQPVHPLRSEGRPGTVDLLAKLTNPSFEHERIVQTLFHPEPTHTFGYQLLGFVAEGVPPSAKTDGDGSSPGHDSSVGRPLDQQPTAAPDAVGRCQCHGVDDSCDQTLRLAGPQGGVRGQHRARPPMAVDGRRGNERGSDLSTARSALGGRTGGDADLPGQIAPQMQRKDGGWAQLPTLESDAYATGEALYTLAQFVKDPMTDQAWQRGLRFLLETQEDDGTWHVARRAFPFQPTMNSGFPHHRDSWISAAATSWAVLALTQVAPVGSASGKPAIAQQTLPVRTPKNEQKIDFAQQIKPLLERSCAACHSGEKPRGLFRVDGRDALLKGGASGEAAIVPGHSEKSPLIDYVSGNVPDLEMPPKAQRKRFPALRSDDVALLRAWIDQGGSGRRTCCFLRQGSRNNGDRPSAPGRRAPPLSRVCAGVRAPVGDDRSDDPGPSRLWSPFQPRFAPG